MSELGDTLGEALEVFEVRALNSDPNPNSYTIVSLEAVGMTSFMRDLSNTDDIEALSSFDSQYPLLDVSKYVMERTGAFLAFAGVQNASFMFGDFTKTGRNFKDLISQAVSAASFWLGAKMGSKTRFSVDLSVPYISFDSQVYNLESAFLAGRFFEWKQSQHQTLAYSLLAQEHLPAGVVQSWSAKQQKDKLQESGFEFPADFERYANGQIIRRKIVEREFTDRELQRIVEDKRAHYKRGRRPIYEPDDRTPSFALVANLEEFLINGDEPVFLDAELATSITP